MFRNFGWDVVIVDTASLMQDAFAEPGGEALRRWSDTIARTKSVRRRLCFRAGGVPKTSADDIGDQGPVSQTDRPQQRRELLALIVEPRRPRHGEHDRGFWRPSTHDRPVCFIAYTIKGVRPADAGPQGQPSRPDDGGAEWRSGRTSQNIRTAPAMNGQVRRSVARLPRRLKPSLAEAPFNP